MFWRCFFPPNQTEPIDASDSHVSADFFFFKYIFPLQPPLQRAGNESGVFLPGQETPRRGGRLFVMRTGWPGRKTRCLSACSTAERTAARSAKTSSAPGWSPVRRYQRHVCRRAACRARLLFSCRRVYVCMGSFPPLSVEKFGMNHRKKKITSLAEVISECSSLIIVSTAALLRKLHLQWYCSPGWLIIKSYYKLDHASMAALLPWQLFHQLMFH